MGIAYVYRLGDTGIFKVGKTTNLEKRQGAYETISTEPLISYAEIETADETEIETFMKHRLQDHRWLGGKGSELYEVGSARMDEVISAARTWNSEMLPKMAEVENLSKQQCDGRVLTPGDLERELHRELLRQRQKELTAAQEQRRIMTELKILMQTASRLDGIATWTNQSSTSLDEERLKRERRPLYDEYYTKVMITRPFRPRW